MNDFANAKSHACKRETSAHRLVHKITAVEENLEFIKSGKILKSKPVDLVSQFLAHKAVSSALLTDGFIASFSKLLKLEKQAPGLYMCPQKWCN